MPAAYSSQGLFLHTFFILWNTGSNGLTAARISNAFVTNKCGCQNYHPEVVQGTSGFKLMQYKRQDDL